MRHLLSIVCLSFVFTACGKSETVHIDGAKVDPAFCKEDAPSSGPGTAAKLDEKLYDHFGAGVFAGASTPVADAVANPAPLLGKPIRLAGPITSVCQTKGCWMHLGTEANPVMVKFQGYSFFVPKDASGRDAVVEGVLEFKQETVAETKHYLEDAGKLEEAKQVTEGRKIYKLLATGVAIRKA